MLRTVHRAIRATSAGAHESFSNSKRPTIKNISSPSPSSSSSFNSLNLVSSTVLADEFDWESIDDNGDQFERDNGFFDHSVPSPDEVHHALSSLQQVLGTSSFYIKDRPHNYLESDVVEEIDTPTRSSESELDWIEPPIHLCNSRALESYRSDQVYDAFHLLQNDSSVQRMVISLSSDKAVWDAVMNNDVVREMRESLNEATNKVTVSSNEASDSANIARSVLTWIFVDTKSKFIELIVKLKSLVNDLFQRQVNENTTEACLDHFDKRVRSSFMVSVVVLLIVVLNRACRS